MINKVRIMLYVDNVEKISQFWQEKLQAVVIETTNLPDNSKNIILKITDDVELSLFAKSFIKTFSPEVLDNKPSLMFFTNQFDELHNKLAPSVKIMEVNKTKTFNFKDPEGNYFVIASKK